MNMKQIAELLRGSTGVTAIGAHLDDEASLVAGILEAQAQGIPVDLVTLSPSTKSSKNHRGPDFSVAQGDRVDEGAAAARLLKVRHFDVLDGQDGQLEQDSETQRLAEQLGKLTLQSGNSHFMVMGVEDHADHLAAVTIARLAAAGLATGRWAATAHRVDILAVRGGKTGTVIASTTPAAQELTFNVLRAHSSQFRFSPTPRAGWWQAPNGLFLHPEDAASLAPYPLQRTAYYEHTAGEPQTAAILVS
jgi:LmbE family N-acetylglucosaminyl deacetylase